MTRRKTLHPLQIFDGVEWRSVVAIRVSLMLKDCFDSVLFCCMNNRALGTTLLLRELKLCRKAADLEFVVERNVEGILGIVLGSNRSLQKKEVKKNELKFLRQKITGFEALKCSLQFIPDLNS